MDQKIPNQQEIQRLILLSASARATLDYQAGVLRRRLDMPARLHASLKHHPRTWLLASLAAGFTTSYLFRRRPPTTIKRRAWPTSMATIAWSVARPLIKIWLGKQLQNWLAGQALPTSLNRLLARHAPPSTHI